MDQETLQAVQQEMRKVSEGLMDALAMMAVYIYASGSITKGEIIDLSRKAAANPKMSERGAQLLRGMCSRLESFKGDVPKPSTPKH